MAKSKEHLAYVASQNCMLCDYPESEPHHLLRADGIKGMGRKTGDNFAVNLCHRCHHDLHMNGNEIEFFEQHGWNYEDVKQHARNLWNRQALF